MRCACSETLVQWLRQFGDERLFRRTGALPCGSPARWMLVLAAGLYAVSGLAENSLPDDLTQISLEELMDVEITSVSKKPQMRSKAAAAVFVVSREDIQSWGVTNIPDALRMVPGLHVGRIDSNKWAVSSRGFNSRFANKLLVLIDGRSVYTPLFAGVYWEAQDVPLDDIERIEVIRGPGGTLWGANAVNGVINIITRRASDTQGGLLSVGAGSEEKAFGTLRYGGQLANGGYYRVYGKGFQRDEGYSADGAHDDWDLGQAGFRTDWNGGSSDNFTLQGDYYTGNAGQQLTMATDPAPATTTFREDVLLRGSNLLFRWQRSLARRSDFALQVYLDHVERDGEVLFEDRDTLDIDFQHHLARAGRHDVLWGLGYRHISDDTRNNRFFSLTPADRSVDLYSAFIQDEISLLNNRLLLTIGSKFEQNDFTGFEYQPNIRFAWTPDDRQTLWGAVSRAVRTPARGEHDVRLRLTPPEPAPPFPAILQGDENFDSEHMVAYELGYRWKVTEDFSIDSAVFYNDYKDLRTFDADVMPPPEVVFPFGNRLEGNTHGLELSAQWQLQPGWRLQGAYTYLQMELDLKNGSSDTISADAENASPRHQASLWSMRDLGHGFNLDTGLRYVDSVSAPGSGADAYVEMDVRLGWRPTPNMTVSLVGRNLLDNHHAEFQPDFIQTQPTEVERSGHIDLKWRF